MAESWMERLMERTTARGQTVDDLPRRNAGIPAAFIALFLSEPEGTPKKLLPRALRWLIDVANKSMLNTDDDLLENLHLENGQVITTVADTHLKTSKTRNEGLVPTVHAFNVLRAAFNDTNLATDTSGFCSEALIISIRSFSSPYWEVRNSACLAYTALVRRMIGFLNVHKREAARHSLTGLEFFHRRVFDKEIDNHHEEKLLICQICCHHLEKILELPYWSVGFPSHHIGKDDIRIYLQQCRAKFFNQLLYFTEEFVEAEGRTTWIGGLGNHKDTFTSIYASLVGLYALSQCPTVSIYLPVESFDTRAPDSSDICKLREILRPFLRNPLISNLYLLVVRSYKKILGPTANRIDAEPSREFSAWKGFDPYFLLR